MNRTSDEQPEVDLADFWGGELPTRPSAPDDTDAPFPYQQLAATELEVGGRNLAAALAPIYRAMTRD